MRLTNLVAVVLVIAASAVIPAAATPAETHAQTPSASASGAVGETQTAVGDLELTGYEIRDRDLSKGDPLRAIATFEKHGNGTAATPLVLSVDGEKHRLGKVVVNPKKETTRFVPDDDTADSLSIDVSCEWRDSDGDGWAWGDTLHCEIRIGSAALARGEHRVSLNGLEPTTVKIEGDGSAEAALTVSDYAIEDRSLEHGQPLNATVTFDKRGDGEAAAPLAITIDGEKHALGRVVADAGNDSVRFVPNEDTADSIVVEIECEWIDTDDDGWVDTLDCDVRIRAVTLASGAHRIGINDLEPTEITVGDRGASDLEIVDYEIEDRSLESDQPLRASIYLNRTGDGEAATPLTLTVDGETRRLGRLVVNNTARNNSLTYVPSDDTAALDVSVECEVDISSNDIDVSCTITINASVIAASGDHLVGVNGLEPTEIGVDRDEPHDKLAVTDYEIEQVENRSARMFVDLKRTGDGEATAPLRVSLDGEFYRLGRFVADGGDVGFEGSERLSPIDIDVKCRDFDGDGDIECVIIIHFAAVAGGDHTVGLDGLGSTGVTIQPKASGDTEDGPEDNDSRNEKPLENAYADESDGEDAEENHVVVERPLCGGNGPFWPYPDGPGIPCLPASAVMDDTHGDTTARDGHPDPEYVCGWCNNPNTPDIPHDSLSDGKSNDGIVFYCGWCNNPNTPDIDHDD